MHKIPQSVIDEAKRLYMNEEMTMAEIARIVGISYRSILAKFDEAPDIKKRFRNYFWNEKRLLIVAKNYQMNNQELADLIGNCVTARAVAQQKTRLRKQGRIPRSKHSHNHDKEGSTTIH